MMFGKIREALNETKIDIQATIDRLSGHWNKIQENSKEIAVIKTAKDSRIQELRTEIEALNEKIKFLDEKTVIRIDNRLKELTNEVELRLIGFHKEVTDKYFATLDKVLRFNKEISLIDSLAHRIDNNDLENLKKDIMQPILAARWKDKEKAEGKQIDKNIETLGDKIRLKRKELYDRYLDLDKKGQPTASVKAEIGILDKIIKGDLK